MFLRWKRELVQAVMPRATQMQLHFLKLLREPTAPLSSLWLPRGLCAQFGVTALGWCPCPKVTTFACLKKGTDGKERTAVDPCRLSLAFPAQVPPAGTWSRGQRGARKYSLWLCWANTGKLLLQQGRNINKTNILNISPLSLAGIPDIFFYVSGIC